MKYLCPPVPVHVPLGKAWVFGIPVVSLVNRVMPRWYRAHPTSSMGISEQRTVDKEVIVSLTSYPGRFDTLWLCIESLLRQTIKPNRIILWLVEDECRSATLPEAVKSLSDRGLDIRYCSVNLRPLNKLYHALVAFPDAVTITADDDIIYREDLVEKLLDSYQRHPDCVSCMTSHRIATTADGAFAPYTRWKATYRSDRVPGHAFFATGVNGVLYPPHCLHPDVMDVDTYRTLSLTNDDLWLKVMAYRAGTRVVMAEPRAHYLACIRGSQETRLTDVDVFDGQNDVIWARLVEHFGLDAAEMLREDV